MNNLNFVVWDPSPEIFTLGSWEMRWYGLLFALGFLISQQIMFYIYRKEGKPEQDVEALTFFMVIATILGARLGHVFFYEPDKYLANPISILKIWEGGLASHGAAIGILIAIYLYANYLIKIDFGTFKVEKRKRPGQNYMWVVDRLVIVVALTGGLIRMGNFINSEIVGIETNSDYGVVFARDAENALMRYSQNSIEEIEASKVSNSTEFLSAQQAMRSVVPGAGKENLNFEHPVKIDLTFVRGIDEKAATAIIENNLLQAFHESERLKTDLLLPGAALPYKIHQNRGVITAELWAEGIVRHPAQLYESISSFLIFAFLFFLWKRKKEHTPPGLIFGIFLIVLFGLRFIYEFFKVSQVDFEDELVLNMGQILSIPLVLAGIFILARSLKSKPPTVDKQETVAGSNS